MGLFRLGRHDWTVSAVNKRSSASYLRESTEQLSFDACSATEPTDSLDRPEAPRAFNRSASTSDINTLATNADILAMKVKLMELTLQQKDETISRIRSSMESEDERVTCLELQIGRLVELSSHDCAREQQDRIIEPPLVARCRCSHDMGVEEEQQHVADKLEITALNELLARVIAEKDRLGYQNNNLKRLLRERSSACSKSNTMPSSIDALDKRLREHQELQPMDRDGEKKSANKGNKKSYKPKKLKRRTF